MQHASAAVTAVHRHKDAMPAAKALPSERPHGAVPRLCGAAEALVGDFGMDSAEPMVQPEGARGCDGAEDPHARAPAAACEPRSAESVCAPRAGALLPDANTHRALFNSSSTRAAKLSHAARNASHKEPCAPRRARR